VSERVYLELWDAKQALELESLLDELIESFDLISFLEELSGSTAKIG